MADNYLEKKMEELRNPSRSSSPRRVAPSANMLQFPFRPVRILFIDNPHLDPPLIASCTSAFATKGCKAAVHTHRSDFDPLLPQGCGVRIIRVSPDTPDSLPREFDTLLKSWRGIDIAIGINDASLKSFCNLWTDYLAQYPSPGFYTPRVIYFTNTGLSMTHLSDFQSFPDLSPSDLHLPDNGSLSRLLLFLSLESSISLSSISWRL